MYDRFYGFSSRPFALTPDPAFLFLSPQHSMALTLLEYGLESQAAFALLTGDIGSGKTTLLRYLIRSVGDSAAVGLVSNTHSGFQSVYPWVAQSLGVAAVERSDSVLYGAIVDCLVREYARGRRTLLIIDEAQNLSLPLLEELRLLSNVNSEKDLVLQILLVGQPELRLSLLRTELRQLAQRISVDFHLKPLAEHETAAYVRHRVSAAGVTADLFDAQSLSLVHAHTGGVPRLINQLCDVALVYGYADGYRLITAEIVLKVLSDRAAADALPVFAGSVPAPAARAPAVRRPRATQ
jgi:type II secretory pathway predicted ATPase ExeA